jgi:hypothetical protein
MRDLVRSPKATSDKENRSPMKLHTIGLLLGAGGLLIFACRQLATRRKREREIAEFEKLPTVSRDFTTPEGAILCLEATYPLKDIEAAVACRDFATEARLWIQERGQASLSEEFNQTMLITLTKTMEQSFREGMEYTVPDWDKARSYFLERTPYGDGLVVVNKVAVGPDRSIFRQRILTSKTANGWRVVTPLVKTDDGWRVTSKV